MRRPILYILAAGTAVHAGVLFLAYHRTGGVGGYAFKSPDCGEYYALARNVARHGVFSRSEEPPLRPDTWRTPGYPLLLAFFIAVLGESPTMLVVAQQLLSILNVWLLFVVVKECARRDSRTSGASEESCSGGSGNRWCRTDDRRTMIAAILFLLEPYHLYYSLWLMSTTWFVTVLLVTWLVWQRGLRTGSWGWCALLGGLCGYLVLVWPIGVLFPFAILAGLAVTLVRRRNERSKKGRNTGNSTAVPAFAVACMAVVGTWMLRNEVVAGHFALSDQGGVVLAYFKAAEVALWREGRAVERYLETTLDPRERDRPHSVWEAIDGRLRAEFASLAPEQRSELRWQNLARGNRTTVDSFVVSDRLRSIGWSYLLASPLSTVTCCVVRCGSLLTFPVNLALSPPAGVRVRRVESALKGSIYLLLCVCVLMRLFRGGLRFERIYFPLAGAVALLLVITPQMDPRFRVPIIPLLLVIAFLPGRSIS